MHLFTYSDAAMATPAAKTIRLKQSQARIAQMKALHHASDVGRVKDAGVISSNCSPLDALLPEGGFSENAGRVAGLREVACNRVWFAEPLLSGATDEIRKLFVRAKGLADKLNLKVVLIFAVFPRLPCCRQIPDGTLSVLIRTSLGGSPLPVCTS